MKLRTVAAASLGAAGALAATNRRLRVDRERLDPPLGRELTTYHWRGFDVAYTEAGDPADPDLLLLHGINVAGSSHEFLRVVADLAEDYHVVAPDLPGFGRSDRPPLLYSGSLYVAFLKDFTRDVVAEPTVVASSITGAYAAVAAEEVPVRELVLVCPTADTVPGRRVWLRSLIRAPLIGQGAYNALTSRPAIRRFLRDHGFADPDAITDDWVEYAWRTAHLPGGRFAPASFVAGFLDLDVDLGQRLADLGVPVTVVWGSEADLQDPATGRATADEAGAAFLLVEDADLLPHAEQPEEFLALLERRREAV
jgi:pimeloyl-ACP methyl ester carboxylesterase